MTTRPRERLRRSGRRLRNSAAPILQCGAAAGVAWFVANDLVGHQRPFFAPIAAVISLGVSLGSRLRRTAELVLGVSLGVLVGDLIIAWIGTGPWQVAVVVVLAMSTAVLANGATLQAGSSAVLVATLLPPGQAGGFDRCIDALIGGGVGLLVAAVLPTDPVGPVRREARALLGKLAGVLAGSADALRSRSTPDALAALRRARATQPLVDQLRAAIRGGREITAVSPLLRRRRRVLARFAEVAERADYTVRNTRVLARRAYTLLGDGDACPDELSDAVGELASSVERFAAELGREGDLSRAGSGCSTPPGTRWTARSRVGARRRWWSSPSCAPSCSTCCRPPACPGPRRWPPSALPSVDQQHTIAVGSWISSNGVLLINVRSRQMLIAARTPVTASAPPEPESVTRPAAST